MSINLTDEIEVKTKKGKLGAAKQIFLEGDTQTVENEIQDINSRHNDLNSKHESLSSTVSEHTNQIESNQNQITANKSTQDAKNASLDANMAKLNTRDDQITELVRGITATGGASVATTVTYDNTSSHLASATVQGAIDELQGSKIDKTSILQELGNTEDKVMSQKAVSDALSTKVDKTDIVQTTGTSTTAVMSQKANTDLFYNISEYIGINEQISFELRNGVVNGNDGSVDYGYTLRLVTTDFINYKSIRIVNSGSVCKYSVAAYSDTGYIGESGWKTETNTYKIPNATKYKLVFAFTNDDVITPSDFDSLGISVITDDNGNVIHSDKSQSLSDSEKQIARSNINAASATDIDNISNDVDNISNELNVITGQLISDVGSFYKNAWIRYSDGEMNPSSGGAKTYIIKRSSLSGGGMLKLITNTESSTFAAVAFYSTEEPSTGSYLKNISVQGINDKTVSHVYYVEIPESGWESILITYMSQYSTPYQCSFLSLISKIRKEVKTITDPIEAEIAKIEERTYANIGSFYKNAWIRYSDGEMNPSSGGAKLYRIKKTDLQSNCTKFFIKTNTESKTFAAVSFYSTEEPSTDSYLKDISVQGINDTTASHVYEVEIPESGWVSAFVLFMSQYSTDFYIKTNGDIVTVSQEDLDNACEQTLQKSKEAAIDLVSPLFNPFALKPFYHHMNQEVNKPAVPGQSLQDIAYAKALGFDMIEANVMKTSDGVHVTKHGSGGKLGNGIKSVDGQDYSDTLFSDVTSAWLRENITYDSLFSKNNTFIPTLAEFCSECKRLSMKVKLGNYSQGALDVARKYLPDDMIFAGSESNRNSGFRGLIERVWSPTQSIDDTIQECKNIKAPINIVISAGTFTQCTDEQLLELSEKAHQAGFTTSMVYPTTSDAIRALKFGIDAICSTNGSCNILYHGNAENVSDIDDNALVITGGSYDESTNTITLPTGATIKLDAANAYRFGLCSIRTIYRGKLSFALGGVNVLSNYESDGVQPVAFCNVIQPDNSSSKKYNWCVITAVEDTVINDLKINCSII